MEQTLDRSSDDQLQSSRTGGHALTTAERQNIDLSDRIKGWGSDLDLKTRPGVPRDKAPDLGPESLYINVQPQVPRGRILKSTEHGQLPPVFGDTCPPRGLSGFVRDVAFRYSEAQLSHWMLLMTADRIDMVEGIAADLARFKIPNIPKEMGLTAELKYNRKGVVKALAMAGAGTAALAALRWARGARAT